MVKIRFVVGIVALVGALGLNLAAMVIHTNAQATPNHAGLIIQSASGQVVTRCITFDDPEITGYELLRRSNLALVVDIAGGGSLCKIQNTGCAFPAQKCFCECQDMAQSCVYWQYYIQTGGAWKYSPLGMLGQKVTNGSINGWAYGAGNSDSGGAMPPSLTIEQICGTAAQQTAASTIAVPAAATPTKVTRPATAIVVKSTSDGTRAATTALTAQSTSSVMTSTVEAPTPTAKPTPMATATVTPQPAPVVVAIDGTPKPSSTPAATNPPEPAVAVTTPVQMGATGTTSYIAFGVIGVVLVGLLLVMRAGQGKGKS